MVVAVPTAAHDFSLRLATRLSRRGSLCNLSAAPCRVVARWCWLALAAATAAVAAARPGSARHSGRAAGAAGAGPLAAAAHWAAKPTIDVNAFVQHNLALYADAVRQRTDRVRALYGGDLDAVVPWNGDAAGETYLWDFFPPAFNCPFRERLGCLSDGGKVVCNWQVLAARCAAGSDAAAVYSLGVRGDVSFEADLANRTGCAVHAFGFHTVDSLPAPVAGVRFNRVGLAPADMPPALLSLPTMMAARGHDRVHLLKVDCEDCEWAVFGELARGGALARVDQVLIELHFRQPATNLAVPDSGVRQVFNFFEDMEAAGLLAFSWEVNHNAGAAGAMPWVIEYSFVCPDSAFMRDMDAWQVLSRGGRR